MPDRPNEPGDPFGGGPDDRGEPSALGAAAPLPAAKSAKPPRRSMRVPAKTWIIVGVVVILLLALVPALASGLKKTPRDKVGISYGGGPFEGSKFQRVVQPGKALFFNGFFDPLYLYPADQQNYIVSKNPDEGSTNREDSIVAPTKDRVQVAYQIAAYYKLNTDELRSFHEQLGLQYDASTTAGWNDLIANTLRPQIENALQQETRRYDVADIYGNEEVLRSLEADVQATLSEGLEAATGGQYFCGPTFEPGGDCDDVTFVIKKVDLPESVVASFESQRNSEIGIVTQQNETLRAEEEARGIQSLAAAGVSGSDYVLLQAIESGKINFWVLPEGQGLTVPSPSTTPGATTPPGGGG